MYRSHTHTHTPFLPLSFKFLNFLNSSKQQFRILEEIAEGGNSIQKVFKICSEPQPLSFQALVSCLVFDPGINYRQSPSEQARLNRAIFGHLEWRRKRTKTKMYKLIMNICCGETVCHSTTGQVNTYLANAHPRSAFRVHLGPP